jgi:hypothetical protein
MFHSISMLHDLRLNQYEISKKNEEINDKRVGHIERINSQFNE